MFLQRETFFESNRWFLLLGLIISFAIPFIIIPIYITAEPSQLQNIIIPSESLPVVINENPFDILQFVTLLYLAGVVFFFGRFMLHIGSLGVLLFKNEKSKNGRYTFVKTISNASPFSFFNWIVYNPNLFSEIELQQIITHEKVHARHYHSIDILLTQLSSIVFWFNPFIWLYKKELQQNLEFIADQTTQSKSDCNKNYQHLLLKTSASNYQMALTNNFYNSLIKKRIIMLHKSRSKKRNLLKFTFILPLLALFIMSFNTKEIILENSNEIIANKTLEEGDIEEVIITKDFTDVDFKKAKEQFAKLGVILKFSGIKRNKDNEIIAIKTEFKTPEGHSGNAAQKGKENKPITPFSFWYNQDTGEVGIGGSGRQVVDKDGYFFKTKDGTHKIQKTGEENNVFIFESDDDDNENVFIIKKDGEVQKIKSTHKNENVHIIHVDEDKILKLDDSIRFGNKYIDKIRVLKTDTLWIEKKGNDIREWVNDNNDGKNLWFTDDDNTFEIKAISKSNNKFFISGYGEKQPLFIIDGKEVSKKKLNDSLDPNDIESVNVLKGAAAIKLYGKKGKNGVIVITTKKKN